MEELQHMGYRVWWTILNARHHGVPHNRSRLWAVGIRGDTMGQGKTFAMPDPLPDHLGLSLSDILNP